MSSRPNSASCENACEPDPARVQSRPAIASPMREGGAPVDVSPQALLGHRLVALLVRGEPVSQSLYDAAVDSFGVDVLVALIALTGQYVHTSMVLSCFQVPAAD